MSINVISSSTNERKQETKDLFDKIRPLLDKGWNYSNSCMYVLDLTRRPRRNDTAWYRDVIEYGESEGYLFKDYSCNRVEEFLEWKRKRSV